MKVFCKTCGIHFPEDFEDSLEERCGFWNSQGLGELLDDDKAKLWEWMFSFDFDDLFTRTGIQLQSGFHREYEGQPWTKIFTGYPDLSEQEQRELQHHYYKIVHWPMWQYKLWYFYARIKIFLNKKGLSKSEPVWLKAIRRSSSAG